MQHGDEVVAGKRVGQLAPDEMRAVLAHLRARRAGERAIEWLAVSILSPDADRADRVCRLADELGNPGRPHLERRGQVFDQRIEELAAGDAGRAGNERAAQTVEPLAARDVAHGRDLILAPAHAHAARRPLGRKRGAIAPLGQQHDRLLDAVVGPVEVEAAGVEKRRERTPDKVSGLVAQHRRELGVGVDELVPLDEHDAVAMRFGQFAELLLALAQRLYGAVGTLAFRDLVRIDLAGIAFGFRFELHARVDQRDQPRRATGQHDRLGRHEYQVRAQVLAQAAHHASGEGHAAAQFVGKLLAAERVSDPDVGGRPAQRLGTGVPGEVGEREVHVRNAQILHEAQRHAGLVQSCGELRRIGRGGRHRREHIVAVGRVEHEADHTDDLAVGRADSFGAEHRVPHVARRPEEAAERRRDTLTVAWMEERLDGGTIVAVDEREKLLRRERGR